MFLDLELKMESIRQLVVSLADSSLKDVTRPVEEKHFNDDLTLENLKNETYNSILALEFENIEASKKKYLELSKLYEGLPKQEKEKIYPTIKQLFDMIQYESSYS